MMKTGKINFVAKTGGIKLEGSDEWLNPSEKAKEYVKPELKGKTVELDLDDKGKVFSFIKEVKTEVKEPSKPFNKSAEQPDWNKKDRYIRAQSASKDASIIVAALISSDKILDGESAWILFSELMPKIYSLHEKVAENNEKNLEK